MSQDKLSADELRELALLCRKAARAEPTDTYYVKLAAKCAALVKDAK